MKRSDLARTQQQVTHGKKESREDLFGVAEAINLRKHLRRRNIKCQAKFHSLSHEISVGNEIKIMAFLSARLELEPSSLYQMG